MNVFERHKKIFEGKKLVDNLTKLITTSGLKFEYPKEFCSGQNYITHLSIQIVFRSKEKYSCITKSNPLCTLVTSNTVQKV